MKPQRALANRLKALAQVIYARNGRREQGVDGGYYDRHFVQLAEGSFEWEPAFEALAGRQGLRAGQVLLVGPALHDRCAMAAEVFIDKVIPRILAGGGAGFRRGALDRKTL